MNTLKHSILISICFGLIVFLFPFSGVGADAPKILKGHSARVTSVVYSPDGSTFASGSWDNTVKLWEAKTGKLIHTFTGHSDSINVIAYSPDGKIIASASDDKTIKLWNVKTGGLEHTLTGHSRSVKIMAYSPNGKTLSSASSSWSDDHSVKLWNTETGDLKYTLTGHSDGINAIAYSPDGKTLASASDDKTVKLWNVTTGELKHALTGHSSSVENVAYSPDGIILASASRDNTIKLWNTTTGEEKVTLAGHSSSVNTIVYSPDGKSLASASDDKSIKLWNTETGKIIHSLVGHRNSANILVYSPTNNILDSIDDDRIKLWNTKTGKLIVNLYHSHSVSAIAHSPDGQTLVSASGDDIHIWDVSAKIFERLMFAQLSQLPERNHLPIEFSFYASLVRKGDLDLDNDNNSLSDNEIVDITNYLWTLDENQINLLLLKGTYSIVLKVFDTIGETTAINNTVEQKETLPHDGLFTRRNNAFGTKLTTGIKELLENGVMIEQKKISFADFMVQKTEAIPLPQPNHALAVSHGIAEIPDYQKRDDRATHYLEIALRTANTAPLGHSKTKAPPVNYVFVVDTSGSMSGKKLDTVKTAIRELFNNLKVDDVLGVIEFNDSPKTVLKATPIKKMAGDEFGKIINSLTADGGTDINLGLSFGIDEISRHSSLHKVNQIFLFSDGNPTSGEMNWIQIRQNLATKMRESQDSLRLATFGFGADASRKELDKLAGITGGQSTFVIEPEDVKHSLQQELGRRTHLAIMNVQMQIEIDPDISILHLYGHDLITDPVRRKAVFKELGQTKEEIQQDYGVAPQPDIITDDKGIRIFVPNLAVGETYWVVFELAVQEQRQPSAFGKATVQYLNTFARQNENYPFHLSPKGQIEPNWVAQHALGLWTSEVVFYALDDLYENDLDTAEKRIQAHISVLETAKTRLALAKKQLADDVITLKKFRSLAQNLGKAGSAADTAQGQTRVYFMHQLNEFGRVRSGFLQKIKYGN